MRVQTVRFDARGGWSGPLPSLDSERTLVIVFGAPEYWEVEGPWNDLRAAFPRSALIGCSTAGEIHGTSIHDRSLVVGVARFDRTDLRAASTTVRGTEESRAAGATLARSLAGPGLKGIVVLSQGLDINGSELL